ncbi:MAG: hypothetical protein H7319_13090 [Spirosoma sp.]|nr:hypothetical protein [Spirosoma sp.]
MKNPVIAVNILFFGLIALSFTAYGQITQKTGGQASPANTVPASVAPAIPLIYLDTLSINANTLFNVQGPEERLDRKINFVFEFYIKEEAVTLHGWRFRRASQRADQLRKLTPDSSEVFLTPVGKSSVAIGPDTYVNNQIFYSKDMKNMIRDIEKVRERNPFLYFIPVKDPVTKRIRYNVLVVGLIAASGSPGVKIINLTDATYQTNPSPPHQSADN